MNIVLFAKLDNREIELHQDTQNGSVGVRLKSGEVRFILWRGYIKRSDAIKLKNARPIKLSIDSYRVKGGSRIDVPDGSFIQGCLEAGEGAYALVDQGGLRII